MKKTLSVIMALALVCLLAVPFAGGSRAAGSANTANMSFAGGTDLERFFAETADGARLKPRYEEFKANAAKAAPASYDEHDVEKARAFLEQETDGIKNGFYFNENYDPNDPSTFAGPDGGISFNENGRMSEVAMIFGGVRGDFDIEDCAEVTQVILYYCDVSSVNIKGCTALTYCDLSYNERLTNVDLSTNTAITDLTLQGLRKMRSVDVSKLSALQTAYCSGAGFTSIDLSGCPNLTNLSLSDTDVAEIVFGDSANSLREIWFDNAPIAEIDTYDMPFLTAQSYQGCMILGHIRMRMPVEQGGGGGGGGIGVGSLGGTTGAVKGEAELNLYAEGNGGVSYYDDMMEGQQFAAYAAPDAEFLGWYDADGELVSDKAIIDNASDYFGFEATLTAKFEGGEPLNPAAMHDISVMRTWLNYYVEYGGDVIPHGQAMFENYDPYDINTWKSKIDFNESYRITKVDFSGAAIQGSVELYGMSELTSVNIENSTAAGLSLFNNAALTEIKANGSAVCNPIDFAEAPALERVELDNIDTEYYMGVYIRDLDFSGNRNLTYMSCLNAPLFGLHVNVGAQIDAYSDGNGCVSGTLSGGTLRLIAGGEQEFLGWYDKDGELYSESAELELPSGTAAELYARFSEPTTPEPTKEPTPAPVETPILPTGDYAAITFRVEDVWHDGTGYQMLLDEDADACGSAFVLAGNFSDGDAPAEVYDAFEYKIPENADGKLDTKNIIIGETVTIIIPAGSYDWVIVNPVPSEGVIYFAAPTTGNSASYGDDFNFEAGRNYEFHVYRMGNYDAVDLTITGESTEPVTETPVVTPTEVPTEVPTEEPTEALTEEPTEVPTDEPTEAPTEEPTEEPIDVTEPPASDPGTEPPAEETPEPSAPAETEVPDVQPTDKPDDPTAPPTGAVSLIGLGIAAAASGAGMMLFRKRRD